MHATSRAPQRSPRDTTEPHGGSPFHGLDRKIGPERGHSGRLMPTHAQPAGGLAKRAVVLAMLLAPVGFALASGLPLCPMAGFLGIPCPGCGLTRAALAALQGDLAGAMRHHPLVFVLVPVYLTALVSVAVSYLWGIRTPTGGPPDGSRAPLRAGRGTDRLVTWVAGVCLAALLAVWVARFFGCFGGPAPVRTLVPRVTPWPAPVGQGQGQGLDPARKTAS